MTQNISLQEATYVYQIVEEIDNTPGALEDLKRLCKGWRYYLLAFSAWQKSRLYLNSSLFFLTLIFFAGSVFSTAFYSLSMLTFSFLALGLYFSYTKRPLSSWIFRRKIFKNIRKGTSWNYFSKQFVAETLFSRLVSIKTANLNSFGRYLKIIRIIKWTAKFGRVFMWSMLFMIITALASMFTPPLLPYFQLIFLISLIFYLIGLVGVLLDALVNSIAKRYRPDFLYSKELHQLMSELDNSKI